jgi:hypothetical protein
MRQFIAYQDKLQMGYWAICFEIYRQTVFCFGKDTLKETMAACCLSAEPKAENQIKNQCQYACPNDQHKSCNGLP